MSVDAESSMSHHTSLQNGPPMSSLPDSALEISQAYQTPRLCCRRKTKARSITLLDPCQPACYAKQIQDKQVTKRERSSILCRAPCPNSNAVTQKQTRTKRSHSIVFACEAREPVSQRHGAQPCMLPSRHVSIWLRCLCSESANRRL